MKRAGMKDDFRKAYIHDHLVQIREVLLDGSFEFLEGLKRYEDLCVDSDVKIDWTRLMAYKKQSIGMFDPILEKIFTDMGITVIRGRGKLADAHTVDVDGKKITAEYIVIGTGARNAQLDIPGKEYTHGSSHFLDLDVMPEHMVCIGAGIISMEFASMALMLGKKVTFVEFAPRALAAYPEEYVILTSPYGSLYNGFMKISRTANFLHSDNIFRRTAKRRL